MQKHILINVLFFIMNIYVDINVYSSKSDGSDYIRMNIDKATTKHSKYISHV